MGRHPLIRASLASLALVAGLAGCGAPDNSPATMAAEKQQMLAPTDTSKLSPEMKAQVDAIMAGSAAPKKK